MIEITNHIKKEWEKIKNYEIFNSFDDFLELFLVNPSGSCFKKYTTYPWSKENFFFGTYDELLDYYKTSTEIPFYLKKYIGKKFGQLEILHFFYKIVNKQKKLYAECHCDCGNSCEKEFKKIIEGKIKTCGNHTKKHDHLLLSSYPKIVKEHWDYDKNTKSPDKLRYDSKEEVYWKDDLGSFKASPNDLLKHFNGSSFPEQAILFYCMKFFHSVKNRFKIQTAIKKYEVDIYIDKINLAIEYDGSFWHKNKYKQDLEKSIEINANNIFLIRVRENELPIISLKNTLSISYNTNEDFYICLNEIFAIIQNYCIEHNYKHFIEKITKEQYENDYFLILNQYRPIIIENNITTTCLIKYWDFEKNKIIPQKISPDDNIKCWFKCPYGFEILLTVKDIPKKLKIKCTDNENCINCKSFYCPLLYKCILADFSKNQCPNIKKYYYYQLFIEKKQNIVSLNNGIYSLTHYSNYISKKISNLSDEDFEIENIFKRNKSLITSNASIISNLNRFFPTVTLSKHFLNNTELNEFFIYFHPLIVAINYFDFDSDTDTRKTLLHIIENQKINAHNWESLNGIISNELFNSIKRIYQTRFIQFSLSLYSIDELKKLIENTDLIATNIDYFSFDQNQFTRNFLFENLKKLHCNLNSILDSKYSSLSESFLNQFPIFSSLRNQKWHEQYNLLFKINSEKIILNNSNYERFFTITYKLRQNRKTYRVIIETNTTNNEFLFCDRIEFAVKNSFKEKYLKDSNPNICKRIYRTTLNYREEIYLGNSQLYTDENPFEIINAPGVVYRYKINEYS